MVEKSAIPFKQTICLVFEVIDGTKQTENKK
jgi:hypothetical protein